MSDPVDDQELDYFRKAVIQLEQCVRELNDFNKEERYYDADDMTESREWRLIEDRDAARERLVTMFNKARGVTK